MSRHSCKGTGSCFRDSNVGHGSDGIDIRSGDYCGNERSPLSLVVFVRF